MTHILELNHVTKTFKRRGGGQVIAVDNVTFTLRQGQSTMVAVAGESGSGKSTLALLLMGQHEPTSGTVRYLGKDLAAMTKEEKAQLRREIQPIFQDPYGAYNPFYRVDHVLQMAISHYNLAQSEPEADDLIKESLDLVGLRLDETLGRYPFELSGGQRQRLMVARALICKPKIIMADEPVSMVDASLRATILSSLQSLNRRFGISVVYITHDLTTAYQICDNILIMYSGSVVEAGSVEQVIRHPKHPYTQLLISSIPLPDTTQRWVNLEDSVDPTLILSERETTGCRFAPRCPRALEKCWSTMPGIYLPDDHRSVSCFFYDDQPTLGSTDLADVFEYR
ncbi:MAG: ABC transporter ATP-binding protein [Anaerolineae bacterium]|nr:ABC transporter ATP-binding protein [Anaerolineae bacterium]